MKTKTANTQACALTQSRSKHIIIAALIYMLFMLVAAFAIRIASASALPVSMTVPIAYDTIDDAARTGMVTIAGLAGSKTVEFGGSVVTCQGINGYMFSMPVTSGLEAAVFWETKAPTKLGKCEVVARFHSHPKAEFDDYFSPIDLRMAHSEKVPVYLLVVRTASFKVYRPGVSKRTPLKVSGVLMSVSLGEKL